MKNIILIASTLFFLVHLTFSQTKIDTFYIEKFDFMEEIKINEYIVTECECFSKDSIRTDLITKIQFCILYLANRNYNSDLIRKKQKISYINKVGNEKWYRVDYDLDGTIAEDYKLKISFKSFNTKAISVEVDDFGSITKFYFDKYYETIKIKNI